MGALILNRFRLLGLAAQQLGPYLIVELLLPGGTLIALALYLYRRCREAAVRGVSPCEAIADELLAGIRSIVDHLPFQGAAALRGAFPERDGLEALAMAPA